MLVQEMTVEKAKEIIDQAIDKSIEFLSQDKPAVAEVLAKQILRCDPEHLSALQVLGLCKYRMERYIEAIEIFQTALEIDPTNADNYNNLGLAYSGLDYTDHAIENFKKAIELKPNALFYNNIALQYRSANNYELALESIQKAIEIDATSPQIHVNLGGLYGEMKDLEKSIQALEKAIEIDPEYAAAHVDLAFANHLMGNWEKAFAEYEWRFILFRQMQFYVHRYDQNKRWDGKRDLNGKRILVYCEQGYGDAIMFARFLPELKERGAYVIAHCGNVLETLMKRMDGVDEVVCVDIVSNSNPAFPEHDFQCPLMSLPHLLGISSYSGSPYIRPVTDKFKSELPNDCLNVGLVWAGSVAHPHDARRSLHLRNLKPLLDIPGVKFYSLQKEKNQRVYNKGLAKVVDYAEECQGLNMMDLTHVIQDFEDTATVLAGLDLVISCDTAVIHLAGAMGVPCWVLLPYNPDWRWGLDGEKTIWYDSLKLFRQSERGNWTQVIDVVKCELERLASENLLSDK